MITNKLKQFKPFSTTSKYEQKGSAHLVHDGRFPFNKNSGLKFWKFHVLNGTVPSAGHSGCIDPTQATARLVIVAVSRIQKSGTGDDNFVKWKGTFRPIDRDNRTDQSGPPSKQVPNIPVR